MGKIALYYHEVSPPSRAVLMVAKELGLELDLKPVDLLNGQQNGPEYRKMFPEGLVPAIDDNGFYLWEGQAILTYLVEKYSPGHSLYPTDLKERAQVNRWLYFDNGSLFPAVRVLTSPVYLLGAEMSPQNAKACREKLSFLDKDLEGKAYLVGGRLSLADISCYATVSYLSAYDFDLNMFKNLIEWKTIVKDELLCNWEVNEQPLETWKSYLLEKKAKSAP